jgi:hypothetical protein
MSFLRCVRITLALFAAPAVARGDILPPLKLNQIQVIGTHNSYRTRPPAALWEWIQKLPSTGAGDPADLDYGHAPLPEQFDKGARSIELDLYADPDGGRFVRRNAMAVTDQPVEAPEPERAELLKPGTKVLHVPDFDFGTTCVSLRLALTQVKTWSDAHPRHLPLFILLETKDETLRGKVPLPGLTEAAPWNAKACDALDAGIREVFGGNAADRVFTPARLRGNHPTLEAAARGGQWPEVEKMRGRVLFVMEGVAVDTYAKDHPSLEGRMCFIYGRPGRPETAFLLMNDAARQQETIARRVREGYIVRTRADSGTTAARTGDTKRRDAALASGAQIISTDYMQPDPRGGKEAGWTTYHVSFPEGGTAGINPVTAPGVPRAALPGE